MKSAPTLVSLLGLALLGGEVMAGRWCKRRYIGWPAGLVRRRVFIRGGFALASLIARYPLQPGRYIVWGVPFAVAVPGKRPDHLRDYVLPPPIPILLALANQAVFQLLPQLAFAASHFRDLPRGQDAS